METSLVVFNQSGITSILAAAAVVRALRAKGEVAIPCGVDPENLLTELGAANFAYRVASKDKDSVVGVHILFAAPSEVPERIQLFLQSHLSTQIAIRGIVDGVKLLGGYSKCLPADQFGDHSELTFSRVVDYLNSISDSPDRETSILAHAADYYEQTGDMDTYPVVDFVGYAWQRPEEHNVFALVETLATHGTEPPLQ